jgi:hypothetical protein
LEEIDLYCEKADQSPDVNNIDENLVLLKNLKESFSGISIDNLWINLDTGKHRERKKVLLIMLIIL